MDPIKQFESEVRETIAAMAADLELQTLTKSWIQEISRYKYDYTFTWLGRPIIQFPQDMIAMQEILWQVQPDLVIETGIAHGGSLVFHASMLELIGKGIVLGIDCDIRPHNREAITSHRMASRIKMIEGDSTEEHTLNQVRQIAQDHETVLVCLDSHHTHEHVLRELDLYASLVTPGSYVIVFDTVIEDLPPGFFPNRSWDKGNNPKTAVWEFLKTHDEFVIDHYIQNKLLITAAPDGYLRRIK